MRTHSVRRLWAVLVLVSALVAPPLGSADRVRFFHSGDGRLHLVNRGTGAVFKGVYRHADGNYDADALSVIQHVFDAPPEDPLAAISLRLIEFIDFLQGRLNPGACIEIGSGWRSPHHNARLRETGRPAASASLHQYGMAADIRIEGVGSKQVWHFVRALGFGGTGYYQGRLVHVDVGPARFWDQTSSGVGTGISADNKLIGLVTDYDRYLPGDRVILRFIRMTRFPIGVATTWTLQRAAAPNTFEEVVRFEPIDAVPTEMPCAEFWEIGQMMNIGWTLPNIPEGRYAIQAVFCGNSSDAMPPAIITPVFEVVSR